MLTALRAMKSFVLSVCRIRISAPAEEWLDQVLDAIFRGRYRLVSLQDDLTGRFFEAVALEAREDGAVASAYWDCHTAAPFPASSHCLVENLLPLTELP